MWKLLTRSLFGLVHQGLRHFSANSQPGTFWLNFLPGWHILAPLNCQSIQPRQTRKQLMADFSQNSLFWHFFLYILCSQAQKTVRLALFAENKSAWQFQVQAKNINSIQITLIYTKPVYINILKLVVARRSVVETEKVFVQAEKKDKKRKYLQIYFKIEQIESKVIDIWKFVGNQSWAQLRRSVTYICRKNKQQFALWQIGDFENLNFDVTVRQMVEVELDFMAQLCNLIKTGEQQYVEEAVARNGQANGSDLRPKCPVLVMQGRSQLKEDYWKYASICNQKANHFFYVQKQAMQKYLKPDPPSPKTNKTQSEIYQEKLKRWIDLHNPHYFVYQEEFISLVRTFAPRNSNWNKSLRLIFHDYFRRIFTLQAYQQSRSNSEVFVNFKTLFKSRFKIDFKIDSFGKIKVVDGKLQPNQRQKQNSEKSQPKLQTYQANEEVAQSLKQANCQTGLKYCSLDQTVEKLLSRKSFFDIEGKDLACDFLLSEIVSSGQIGSRKQLNLYLVDANISQNRDEVEAKTTKFMHLFSKEGRQTEVSEENMLSFIDGIRKHQKISGIRVNLKFIIITLSQNKKSRKRRRVTQSKSRSRFTRKQNASSCPTTAFRLRIKQTNSCLTPNDVELSLISHNSNLCFSFFRLR